MNVLPVSNEVLSLTNLKINGNQQPLKIILSCDKIITSLTRSSRAPRDPCRRPWGTAKVTKIKYTLNH